MLTYYDKQGQPLTLFQWAELYEHPTYRNVRQDMIGGDTWLSTVWTGIPSIESMIYGGPPCIFETMRFRIHDSLAKTIMSFPDPDSGERTTQVRYCTEDEAYQGHMKILELIREREMS